MKFKSLKSVITGILISFIPTLCFAANGIESAVNEGGTIY